MNELRSIATFAKAVELGSLRRAAQAQGLSPQAASQAVAQLEEHLGVRLLHRTTRHISLTDEGRLFLEAAQPAVIALERALQRARSAKDENSGPLRIVGPRSTFLHVLWPVIDEFCLRHPQTQPEVQLSDKIGNWVQDRVDVGFRIGAPPEEGLIARRLFPLQLIVCAAPAYLEAHGAPDSLEDLALHRCSVFRHPETGQIVPWYVLVDGEVVTREVTPALSTNDTELEVEAVLAGRVLGLLAGTSAVPHIRAGRLVPVLSAHASSHMNVYVYYGSRTAQPARVRAFIDMTLDKLANSSQFVMTDRELALAEAKGRKAIFRK